MKPRLFALGFLASPALALATEPVSFNRDIRPIMSDTCFHCHGFDPQTREAGLRLDVRDAAIRPTEAGTVGIVPGDPSRSAVMQRLLDDEDPMPPQKSHKTLTADQKELFKRWIAEGAVYETHWSLVPVQRQTLPPGFEGRHAVDAFIQAELTKQGLRPSAEAPKAILLKRLSLDLTGLPPTLAELEEFEKDNSPSAYSRQVERLLKSPAYGERWGRWWLDQARYADSNGYSIDAPRQIWKFREWVIEALNNDMPFDQFTVEQLAGDMLPHPTESQKIATGFHRNTQLNEEGGIDKEQFRIESVFDRVATTGTVWLGLTIGCAQCHDHKFDPIEQKEYYQLFAFFNNQEEPELKTSDASADPKKLRAELAKLEGQIRKMLKEREVESLRLEQELSGRTKLPRTIRQILAKETRKRTLAERLTLFSFVADPGDEILALNELHKELSANLKNGVTTLVLKELPKPRKTTVFIKGDFTRPDSVVSPGTPKALHPFDVPEGRIPNRLDLAEWLMHADNPLTARVLVNRLWQQYFGRGLVETENDFGSQGSLPSHPELLDWLASELKAQNWSLKAMHRLIVTSETYRQDSGGNQELLVKDPDNRLLARQSRLRLDAEIVRDVCLAASGLLSNKRGGPPVFPPIPDGIMGQGQVKRIWATSQGEDRYRRSIYTFIYRASPPPWLTVFDAPDGITTCTNRMRSNTPLQSLTLLNDSGFFECAEALGKIIDKEGLSVAFRRCTSRSPQPDELALLERLEPLTAARVLLNLDETITRE